ncbi:MAG: hypothetical protein J7L95_07230 [Prolixibacteraceae bacterium]|nr:hypothetical protein [Prolixibacteraceae bacterium]
MRLILNSNGTAQSLIHKASGQECLAKNIKTPVFAIIQNRPYDNENQLTFPAKRKVFAADSVYRLGNNLIVGFELTDYTATVGLKITDNYIGFKLKKLQYKKAEFGVKRKTRIDEFTLLQLPVKKRKHFGAWLNVAWDDGVAVNLLATDPFARIDACKRDGYYLMYANASGEVKQTGVGAALITTGKNTLLDRIDRVERDFNLPLGVESRRSKAYKNSYYELRKVTPQNIDEHIHYSKARKNDAYVTPVPDNRLNLRKIFTLAKNLGKNENTIAVEENPAGITLEDGRRILKIGRELVEFETYTTTPPYQFQNCKRGILNTTQVSRKAGDLIGLLDVDTWPVFVRFNQKTTIQKEVAERLAEIVKEAGFKFLYFDGAEDVPPPYWYNVSKAQLTVYNALETKPIFSEGALKSHFSWHLITRGNAFDTFAPEFIKDATRKHPLSEIKLVSNDFTSIDFGWIKYTPPSDKTIGIQPDMLEFVTSRAAGWNSIISLLGDLDNFKIHPRNKDNLEVIRRWEEVRATGFLTKEQKEMLHSPTQEHILLINESGNFELHPYQQINVANGNKNVRAFIFERNNKPWVVYWHTQGEGTLTLNNVKSQKVHLFEKIGEEITVNETDNSISIPAGDRRYIEFDLNQKKIINLFARAVIR